MGNTYTRRPGTTMIGGHIPDEEVALIDAYLQQLRDNNPGVFVPRLTALRKLCLEALKAKGLTLANEPTLKGIGGP